MTPQGGTIQWIYRCGLSQWKIQTVVSRRPLNYNKQLRIWWLLWQSMRWAVKKNVENHLHLQNSRTRSYQIDNAYACRPLWVMFYTIVIMVKYKMYSKQILKNPPDLNVMSWINSSLTECVVIYKQLSFAHWFFLRKWPLLGLFWESF